MVHEIVQVAAGLTPAQIRSAAAVAPMIEAVASLLSAFKPGEGLFSDDTLTNTMTVSKSAFGGLLASRDDTRSTTRVTEDAASKTANYIRTFVSLVEQIGQPLKDLVIIMSGIEIPNASRVGRNMDAVAAVMNAVGSAGDALSSIMSIGGDERDGLTFRDIQRIKNDFGTLALLFMDSASGDSILGVIGLIIDPLTEFGRTYGRRTTSSLQNVSGLLGTDIPAALQSIGDLATTASILAAEIPTDWYNTLVAPIEDMITQIGLLDDELESMEAISVNALLHKVGAAFGVQNETITVTRGNVNVDIKLNVTMQASELSRTLVEGNWVEKGTEYEAKLRALDR